MKKKLPIAAGILAIVTAGFFATTQLPSADEKPKAKPVYSVSKYDPKRDPVKDLAATVAIAGKDERRILLLVGGDW